MLKILDYSPVLDTGEPAIQIVDRGLGLVKTASNLAISPKIKEYIAGLKSTADKIYAVVNAMGASEFYGPNKNGDAFPEYVLKEYHPTFVTDGKPFMHHINKDPNKCYGNVLCSDYNDLMHRVELVVEYDTSKLDSKYVKKIVNGELVNVSMGCRVPYDLCLIKGTLIRTSKGHKKIENIEVGDLVQTHTGKFFPVTKLFTNETESLVTIKAAGSPKLTVTPNHPIYILKKNDLRSCRGSANGIKRRHSLDGSVCTFCNHEIKLSPSWINASDVNSGDYVLTPVDSCNENETVGEHRARLLGYYIGDGNIIDQKTGKKKNGPKRDMGFCVTVGNNYQEHYSKVLNTIEKSNLKNGARSYSYRNAKAVNVYDQEFAAWLQEHGGRYSDGKRLSEQVMSWSENEKIAFLSGYIDTDGCFDESGAIRISTINRGLALDTVRILRSIGIPASVTNAGVIKGFREECNGPSESFYYIYIPSSHSHIFFGKSVKVTKIIDRIPAAQGFFWNGYYCMPVKSVTKFEKKDIVYNISVDTDESYVAEGIITHNCSICSNIAKTPDEYCKCLTSDPGIGRITGDGRRAFAINTKPTFFDISIVTIPADPTARILVKVANTRKYYVMSSSLRAKEEGLSEKTATEVPVNLSGDPRGKGEALAPALEHAASLLEDMLYRFDSSIGSDLPKELLNRIGESSSNPFSILNHFIENKQYLRPHEVQRIVLVSSGRPDIADELDANKLILNNNPSRVLSNFDTPSCSPLLSPMDSSMLDDRSMSPDNVQKIVIRLVLPESTKIGSLEQVPISDDFRQLAGNDIEHKLPTILDDPIGALKTYLALGSIVSAFSSLLGKSISPQLLGGTALASAAVGPQMLGILRDTNNLVNAPVQEMHFTRDSDLPRVEEALANAIEMAQNMQHKEDFGAGIKTSSWKKIGAVVEPINLRKILSLPFAYGASKLVSEEAKKNDIEQANITGQYNQSFLSHPEYSFLVALPIAMKYASASNKVKNYIEGSEKTLNKKFHTIFGMDKEGTYRKLKSILFGKK